MRFYVGEIKTNIAITDNAKRILESTLKSSGSGFHIQDQNTITFEEHYTSDLETTIEGVIKQLAPMGYVLNGSVNYYDTYGDGRVDVNNNDVALLSAEEAAILDATDDILIEELKRRGFTVIKCNTSN